MPEDDNYSLSSSDCDTGSFTSSTSTSTTGRQVHPGPTSGPTAQDPTSTKNPRSIHLQNGPQGSPELCQPSLLGSRDASATPYQDRIVSADLSSSSETSFEEGVDYTRAIRYPNHSKIHVAPLVDEDRVVLRPEAERLGVAGAGGKPLMKRMPSKESQDGGGYKAPDVAEQRSPVYFEGNCYSDQGMKLNEASVVLHTSLNEFVKNLYTVLESIKKVYSCAVGYAKVFKCNVCHGEKPDFPFCLSCMAFA